MEKPETRSVAHLSGGVYKLRMKKRVSYWSVNVFSPLCGGCRSAGLSCHRTCYLISEATGFRGGTTGWL